MTAAGIIFSNIHDKSISELTKTRTMAAVPFLCKYRLIDFALSNMVNSGISNINIIAHHNYSSLIEHIGSGKDWDLARHSGGVHILPPFISAYSSGLGLYETRLEAMLSVSRTIFAIREKYTVLSDCNVVCNVDLNEMIAEHEKSNATVTIAVKPCLPSRVNSGEKYIVSDSKGRIKDIVNDNKSNGNVLDRSLNICVINTDFLKHSLREAELMGYKNYMTDIILTNTDNYDFRIFRYNDYLASIDSLKEYYSVSMDILSDLSVKEALFGNRERPIYTRVRNSPPTVYGKDAELRNSLIADGCNICGCVENSIVSRGVIIKKGAVIRNSILFSNCVVSSDSLLNCVIADKNIVINSGKVLSGCRELPFYINKDTCL